MHISQRQPVLDRRRGTFMPAIAVGLIVAAGAIALVFDQLWLSAAQSELQTSANAAALASAQKIADEAILKLEFDSEAWAEQIRETAGEVALHNRAAGQQVAVNLDPHGDVRMGRPIVDEQTGQETFIETDHQPSSVLVTTHCDRANGNPVSLFMPYLTGQPHGDVVASAEATISNQISAVRPLDNANVPAWPIAILAKGGDQLDDWESTVEAFAGKDEYSWDTSLNMVRTVEDGLPEMVLKSGAAEGIGNVRIIDLGTNLFDDQLELQFKHGLTWQHLQEFGSELGFEKGPLSLASATDFQGVPFEQLAQQIGQTRIVLLYEKNAVQQSRDSDTVEVTRLVSVRLMSVQQIGSQIEMVVQPTVIATRTARLSENSTGAAVNKYIYRLALTQ